jgi:hypothetical protein
MPTIVFGHLKEVKAKRSAQLLLSQLLQVPMTFLHTRPSVPAQQLLVSLRHVLALTAFQDLLSQS